MSKFVERQLTFEEATTLQEKWGENAENIALDERYDTLMYWNNQTGEILYIVNESSGKLLQ